MKRATTSLTFAFAFAGACGSFDAAPDPATSTSSDAGSDAPATDANDGGASGPLPEFVTLNTTESMASQTSATVLLDSFSARDSVILAIAVLGAADITSITDTLGGKFERVVGPSTRSDGDTIYVAFAPNIPTSGSEAITVKTTAFGGRILLYAHEYKNLTAFDTGKGVPGDTPGMIASPKITTKSPNELLFGFAISGSVTEGAGFTVRSKFDANLTEDRILDVAGETSASAMADKSWVIIGAAFK